MSGQMRKEFEEWAIINGMRTERKKSMAGSDMGSFEFAMTEAAFDVWKEAWQASRKALVVELPRSFHDNYGQYVYDEQSTHDALEKAGVTYK